MSAGDLPRSQKFDLSEAAALKNRKLPSVKWVGYGVLAFLAIWTALVGVVLIEGPHNSIFCYRIFCSAVPLTEYYEIWGALFVVFASALMAVSLQIRRPTFPPNLKLRLSSAGLDIDREPRRPIHIAWPTGSECLIVFDWRTLSPGGRKYSPAPGSLKNGESGDSFPLSSDAVDGTLAYARGLGLSVISSSEVLSGLTSNLGVYTRYTITRGTSG